VLEGRLRREAVACGLGLGQLGHHFRVPPTLVKCAVLLRRGVPTVDHQDRILSGEGCCITLGGGFIDFHASGLGPCGHKTLHQATVSELVLDGVGVVWACFFKELLEVVCRWSCLALAIACGLYGMLYGGAACLLVDATSILDCDLLALFAPFLAGLGILLDTLDYGAGQCLPSATRRWSKSCRLGMWVVTAHHSLAAHLGHRPTRGGSQ
jgi:hypothetical protein